MTLLSLASACGPAGVAAPELLEPTRTGDAFEGVNCSAIRPPTEPDLMAWDPGQRANLKQLGDQGVVGVRYKAEGCNVELEVLDCVGRGVRYGFSPYSASETKLARSQRDLYTELPIGAARLGGKVGGGRALRTDYMLAGVLATPVMRSFPPDKLEGDCDRATHVVSRLYVGGFAMASGQSETLAAEASLFGAGAGASQDRRAERIASEGSAKACERAQEAGTREHGCSVPLRIGLTPIEGRDRPSCPEGTAWDGQRCARPTVAKVECPAGSKLEGGKCVASVDTSCPTGMRFETGKGCVAQVATGPSQAAGGCPSGMVRIEGGSYTPKPRTKQVSTPATRPGETRWQVVVTEEKVSLEPFCVDRTEVTVGAYEACVKAKSCERPSPSKGCNWGQAGREAHPMNCVGVYEADKFCKWAGKRLPAQVEWEWTARGGVAAGDFPWGAAAPDGRVCWSQSSGTCPAGSRPTDSTRAGVLDLGGNVREWLDTRESLQGQLFQVSGGAWSSAKPDELRAHATASRLNYGGDDVGFRCVR